MASARQRLCTPVREIGVDLVYDHAPFDRRAAKRGVLEPEQEGV